MSTATGSRNWRAKQKKLGLCLDCSRPAAPGSVRCKRHVVANRRNVHAYYWRHKTENGGK